MRAHHAKHWLNVMVIMFVVPGLILSGTAMTAAAGSLKPLNTVTIPIPPNLADFVVDQQAAIQLGKAFFWDMQAGSDGVQACASCHYHAGEDIRVTNTINPGFNGIFNTVKPGRTLTAAKFPIANGDVVGSAGVIKTNFSSLSSPLSPVDVLLPIPDTVFNLNGVNVRQVTGRNAPTMINAVYNFRSFWDGRANHVFNGVNPNGPSDLEAVLYKYNQTTLALDWVNVAIPNASLASQATGPIGSAVEMVGGGRPLQMAGRKLLGLPPLALQQVDPTDSVLGTLSASPANGLKPGVTYESLIKLAFDPVWWQDTTSLINNFTQMEQNFSLFWGLSIMLYEATLVSDQTPVDLYLAGQANALTANQVAGLKVYTGKGRCDKCHGGAELSQASVGQTGGNPTKGFMNTAVRPVKDDGGDILQPGRAAFKATGLRNIELRGPYFHNGDKATLRQVVEFYNQGGDFFNKFTDSDIRLLKLTEAEKVALVDFMIALTDDRVRYERAPFDHPSLAVADGPSLPAVGAAGMATPLATFMNLSPFGL
jgi:cytochrome c peroxidase